MTSNKINRKEFRKLLKLFPHVWEARRKAKQLNRDMKDVYVLMLHLKLLSIVSQGNRSRNKNKQMKPNQTYKLLYSKGNHTQNEKTTYRMGENICKEWNWQEINFQNIQTAYSSYSSVFLKAITQTEKWAEDLNMTFLQRRHTDGQQAHGKMLNTANY